VHRSIDSQQKHKNWCHPLSDFKAEIMKCTKFDFAPDPTGEAYIAPPDPLAGFKGDSSKCDAYDFDPQSKIVRTRLLRSYDYVVSFDRWTVTRGRLGRGGERLLLSWWCSGLASDS